MRNQVAKVFPVSMPPDLGAESDRFSSRPSCTCVGTFEFAYNEQLIREKNTFTKKYDNIEVGLWAAVKIAASDETALGGIESWESEFSGKDWTPMKVVAICKRGIIESIPLPEGIAIDSITYEWPRRKTWP